MVSPSSASTTQVSGVAPKSNRRTSRGEDSADASSPSAAPPPPPPLPAPAPPLSNLSRSPHSALTAAAAATAIAAGNSSSRSSGRLAAPGKRRGCGAAKSWSGIWPNSLICSSSTRRSSGGSPSSSTAPSYALGQKTLSAPTAAAPRCLCPKMRSTHLCSAAETASDSRAWRHFEANSCGDPAHGGSSTSPTCSPEWRQPSCRRSELTRNEAAGGACSSGQ
mmetsp:Transcript_17904/g.57667  ORF Transcript_17904/g.57667 Transcript_17904/m.57667 type:complete len:221 (+) Transcript_17904:533-1195(+)